jgi:hypothetical protein
MQNEVECLPGGSKKSKWANCTETCSFGEQPTKHSARTEPKVKRGSAPKNEMKNRKILAAS